MKKLLTLVEQIVKEAVKEIMPDLAGARQIDLDLNHDIKIKADKILETFILKRLTQETKYPILAEESGLSQGDVLGEGNYWIVDPLDGSLNFSRAIPLCCISIALWKNNQPVLGVIYDFNRQELFSALVGTGAWLNGKPIKVSATAEKTKAILTTGFPAGTDYSNQALKQFVDDVKEFKKVRLLGTAALSLAYVACGRADYYWEEGIKLWDVAAGLCLVKAAGGVYKISKIRDNYALDVKAANSKLIKENS